MTSEESVGLVEFVDWNHRHPCPAWKGPLFVIDRRQMEFVNRVIPRHRFVEYEPSDLAWLIPLGMAPEVKIDESVRQRAAKAVVEKMELDVMRPSWCDRPLWLPGQD
jgi:hypothetical protein